MAKAAPPQSERILQGLKWVRENRAVPTGLGYFFPPHPGLRFPPQRAQPRRSSGAPVSLRPGLTARPPLRGSFFVSHTPPPKIKLCSHADAVSKAPSFAGLPLARLKSRALTQPRND